MIRITSLVVLAAAALTLPASAANLSQQEEAAFRQNCSGDYMRLCSMFDPDSPQVEQCFKEKSKQLTPNCQATIAAYSKANPSGRKR